MESEKLQHLALDLIEPSLTNPRKTFNAAKLQELAASIKASGVHQHILVRPLPASRVADTSTDPATGKPRYVRPVYEMVFGERRYRASKLAGLDAIPVVVRDLSDDQVLEIQCIENLQRDDLAELEEAEGFATLMSVSNLNADQVGEKIGKSRAYVYARLKLLDLCQEVKQAMREGKLKASHALLIARIPDAKLQSKALAEATRPLNESGDQFISERAFQSWLQANVMLRLESANFNITDTRLLKGAGSCKDCPKRTGANPDLFAEVNSADICTDPACYNAKSDAHRTAMLAKAEAKGMRLIEGKEALEICPRNSSKLDGYLPLSQVRDDARNTGTKAPTLRELLGNDAPSPVLIEHPVTKELIEAVPKAETEALLITRGLITATQQEADKDAHANREIETLKKSLDEKVARISRQALFDAVVTGIRATPSARVTNLIVGNMLREWFLAMVGDLISEDDMALMLGYTFEEGVDEMDALTMHIRACSTPTLQRALVIYMALQDTDPAPLPGKDGPPILNALCNSLNINADEICSEVKKTVKAQTAAAIKALKESLHAKTEPSVTPAADALSKGEGGEPEAKAPNSRPRKTKLSATEALSGIAAAMQGDEHQAATAPPDGLPAAEPLLTEAIALVQAQNKGSISLVQRHLKISYNRAARLLDLLEQQGVVSPMDNSGVRTVIKNTSTPQLGLQVGFVVGQAVRVSSDEAVLGPIARKWKGREGTIYSRLGDDCYQVKLSKGGTVPMEGVQLEVVAA